MRNICQWLVAAVFAMATCSASQTQAQFGGTQDMMLQKQQQRLEQATRGDRPSPPSRPTLPGRPSYPHRPTINQFYFQYPGYPPYGYYPSYPYAAYPGYGYYDGPILYPPRVTVVPHGVPLSSDLLNGTYGTVPFGSYLPPAAVAPRANLQEQIVAPDLPVAPPAPALPEDEIKRRVQALKPSTEAGRLRCDELIADGDREFVAQQYRKAAAKYREAITKAPDYPPGLLRAGHAYIATGDYELAVTYLAMGFELARTTNRPGFTLTDLYQGNQLAKEQHLERLADAVLRQPEDGGLLFLAGIFQHYDGKPLQARDYFRRAAQLLGRHQPYAKLFLPQPAQDAEKPAD